MASTAKLQLATYGKISFLEMLLLLLVASEHISNAKRRQTIKKNDVAIIVSEHVFV